MRIVIDGRLWSESGLGRYIRNLVNELQKIDSQNEYLVLLLKKDYDSVLFTNNFHKVLADFKWYGVSEQIKMPKLLAGLHPDLVHFPHFNVPIFYKGKFIVTIHDLIHQHFQMKRATTHDPLTYSIKKFGYNKIFKNAVLKSIGIIVPSNFVKKQLISEYGVNKNKITVTYEAVEETIINLSKENNTHNFTEISQKLNIKKPYLFYVGNAHPHKNLSRLINVFGRLKEKYPNLSLVLSGPDHFFWQQIKKLSNHRGLPAAKAGLIFTGFVSEEEMVVLYKNAEMFMMPSLEEGFGIPILEAMACSCPVVSSNVASLPEVGGDAAIYFDPQDENDMIAKIFQVLDSEKLKEELIKKGEKRYKEFSWQKMAELTLEVYKEV